jgi:hypothetical protein
MELQLSSPTIAAAVHPGGPPKRKHRRSKAQLLTRRELDSRSNAAKFFDRLVIEVENDLGGRENLSSIERALIEAFAGATVSMNHLNTLLLLGQPIDFAQHCASVSAMVRVASRLGLQRRSKDVGPSLQDYLVDLAAEKPAGAFDNAAAGDAALMNDDAPAATAEVVEAVSDGGDES